MSQEVYSRQQGVDSNLGPLVVFRGISIILKMPWFFCDLLKSFADRLFCSVGVHPTNCNEIASAESPQSYLSSMKSLIEENRNKVAAVGEFGLDYDRLHFCAKDTQVK